MRRRPRFLRRRLLPVTLSVVAGLAVGVGVAGLPDSESLNPTAVRPPLTVKPGAIVDPSELTVPPMIRSSSTVASGVMAETETASTTTVSDALRAQADIQIMVANGNGGRGIASQQADQIEQLGYARPQLSDTAVTLNWTVYYAPGFEREASRLIEDWGISLLTSAPLDQGPATRPGFEGQLLVVIGSRVLESTATTTTTTTTTVAVSP